MGLATRITVGILVVELVAMAALLVIADRSADMGWAAIGMDHWTVGLGFALPPLIALTAVALVLLVGTRIVMAEETAWRARRRQQGAGRP
jgi:predicted Kef-type K+ transport protein